MPVGLSLGIEGGALKIEEAEDGKNLPGRLEHDVLKVGHQFVQRIDSREVHLGLCRPSTAHAVVVAGRGQQTAFQTLVPQFEQQFAAALEFIRKFGEAG